MAKKIIKLIQGSLQTAFFVCCLSYVYAPAAQVKTHNPELYICPDDIFALKQKGEKIIFVDVRLKADFDKFRIPKSINVPLYTIKTKEFLNLCRVILVNEGSSYSQLEQECLNLKNAGFSVSILQGGLNCWKQKGNALEGDLFAQAGLNQMPPEALFVEKDYGDWLIIDISYPADAKNLIPQAVGIPLSNNNVRQFIWRIKNEIDKRGGKNIFSVLIVNKKGDEYGKAERILEEAGIKSVFYLKGGLDGYKTFLKNMGIQPQIKYSAVSIGTTGEKNAIKPCSSCR